MPRPHVYNTQAVVIRSNPLGEADRLLTIFTPGLGKLRVTARGVRRPTSKLGGHLDPLTRSSLTLAKGKTLDTITSADTLAAFLPLKSDLERLSQGLYLAELVDALNPLDAPNPSAYSLLLEGLEGLGSTSNPHLLLRYLELHLLAYTGFLPEIKVCVECRADLTPGNHLFSPQAGGLLCPTCRPLHPDAAHLSVEALKVVRYLSSATDGESAIRLRVSRSLEREVAGLTTAFLRYILEREMRSLAFLRMVDQREPDQAVASPASS